MLRRITFEQALGLLAVLVECDEFERAHESVPRRRSVGAGNAQYFLESRVALQDATPSVRVDTRRHRAGVLLEILFAGTVVDHRAHRVVDDDQLVDAGAASKAAAVTGGGTVERGRRCRIDLQSTAFVLPRGIGHLGIVVEYAYQALGKDADQA